MSKRLLATLLLMIAICTLCTAKGAISCRLTRTARPDAGDEGLITAGLTASTKEELTWTAAIRGHHLTFRIRRPGESLLAGIEIKVDGQDPISSTGTVVFGDDKVTFIFTPAVVYLDAVRFPIYIRLERYRHINKEYQHDPRETGASPSGLPGFAKPDLRGGKVEYIPYISGWELLIGNAEVYTGKFQLKPGRWCALWLIDADLNGSFGDSAAKSGGDRLVWEYESRGFLGMGGLKRGDTALAPDVWIAGEKYALSLAADGPDAIVLEMKE
ncbi:MAG: hypothetical protein ACM3ZC_03690 [Bacteroidota bacterium]